jgi:protein phosphatase
VQKLVDEGYLTIKEAENHPNKNIIMRALGDNNNVEIDLSKIKLNSSDDFLFFMCTDGVTGVMNDNELEKIFSNYNKINDTLTKQIIQRGAPDNFSFVIIAKNS